VDELEESSTEFGVLNEVVLNHAQSLRPDTVKDFREDLGELVSHVFEHSGEQLKYFWVASLWSSHLVVVNQVFELRQEVLAEMSEVVCMLHISTN